MHRSCFYFYFSENFKNVFNELLQGNNYLVVIGVIQAVLVSLCQFGNFPKNFMIHPKYFSILVFL